MNWPSSGIVTRKIALAARETAMTFEEILYPLLFQGGHGISSL